MKSRGQNVAFLSMLALLLSVTAMIGCGSSATTSSSEAADIATAEQRFLTAWKSANSAGVAQCSKRGEPAGTKCYQDIIAPLEADSRARFSASIESLLEGGVGPECADALHETLSTINSVPLFPGGAASICRSESRKTS